jgi:ADP-dependent phosphofructokinase/glucokinase
MVPSPCTSLYEGFFSIQRSATFLPRGSRVGNDTNTHAHTQTPHQTTSYTRTLIDTCIHNTPHTAVGLGDKAVDSGA